MVSNLSNTRGKLLSSFESEIGIGKTARKKLEEKLALILREKRKAKDEEHHKLLAQQLN